MLARHGISVAEAMEAIADPDAVLFSPDPKSRSGSSARLLGYSAISGAGAGDHPRGPAGPPGRVVGCERVGRHRGRPESVSKGERP